MPRTLSQGTKQIHNFWDNFYITISFCGANRYIDAHKVTSVCGPQWLPLTSSMFLFLEYVREVWSFERVFPVFCEMEEAYSFIIHSWMIIFLLYLSQPSKRIYKFLNISGLILDSLALWEEFVCSSCVLMGFLQFLPSTKQIKHNSSLSQL